nr:UDP-N-acetylglucosamine transferase subunit ALG14 homolog [Ipomoea batatas]
MEKGNARCIYDAVSSNAAILFFIGAVTIVIIRVLFVMYRSSNPPRPKSPRPLSTLIVLGSGGHTAEMMNLLSVLEEDRFKPRFYIAAATDNMSLQKARVFEDSLVQKIYLLETAVSSEESVFLQCVRFVYVHNLPNILY